MIARGFMAVALCGLSACAPVDAPRAFVATETTLEVGGLNGRVPFRQVLPAIEVRRGDGAPLMREDWVAAESAAGAHCAEAGAVYDPLPPARDYTQIRLDDGVFYFMARCLR